MGRVIPAFAQYFDEEGKPLANGWLRFLVSGSNNTNKDTFADPTFQIANANPIQLDAAGRCPNVFGTGDYRVVSFVNDPEDEDSPGEQIQQFDPVTAQESTAGGVGSGAVFDQWEDAPTSYELGAIVEKDLVYYRSLIASNTGLDPALEESAWERVDFLRYYNSSISYSIGDLVYDVDNLYLSLQDVNQGNAPSVSPTYWRRVADGYLGYVTSATAYVATSADRDKILIFTAAAVAPVTFALPLMGATTGGFRVGLYNASDYTLTVDVAGTASIWLDGLTSVDIEKGAFFELIYNSYLDMWITPGNVGPVLGGQDLGTALNPVAVVHAESFESVHLLDGDSIYFGTDNDASIVHDGSELYFNNTTGTTYFQDNGSTVFSYDNSLNVTYAGHILPETDQTQDLGSLTQRWYNVWTQYLSFSNATYIGSMTGQNLQINAQFGISFQIGGFAAWDILSTGLLRPAEIDAFDIGDSTFRVNELHVNNVIYYEDITFNEPIYVSTQMYFGDGYSINFGDGPDFYITHTGSNATLINGTGILYLVNTAAESVVIRTNNIDRWFVDGVTGDLLTSASGPYNIGNTSTQVDTLHTGTVKSNGGMTLDAATLMYFDLGGAHRWQIRNTDGYALAPSSGNAYDIGLITNRVRTIYLVNAPAVSDFRLKNDITHSQLGLEFIDKLDPIQYTLKDQANDRTRYGFVAQEVMGVLRLLGYEYEDFCGLHFDKDADIWSLDYTHFISIIVNAVQELKRIIDDQTKKLSDRGFLEPDNK